MSYALKMHQLETTPTEATPPEYGLEQSLFPKDSCMSAAEQQVARLHYQIRLWLRSCLGNDNSSGPDTDLGPDSSSGPGPCSLHQPPPSPALTEQTQVLPM